MTDAQSICRQIATIRDQLAREPSVDLEAKLKLLKADLRAYLRDGVVPVKPEPKEPPPMPPEAPESPSERVSDSVGGSVGVMPAKRRKRPHPADSRHCMIPECPRCAAMGGGGLSRSFFE